MRYTFDYLETVKAKIGAGGAEVIKSYEFSVDGDYNMPPVLDSVRYITEMLSGLSDASKERLLIGAVLGKRVTVSFRGKEVGAFVANLLTDKLDNFQVLHDHPFAVMALTEIVCAWLVGKATPLLTENVPQAAAGAERAGGTQ